jgi:hypothetical protein
MKYLLLIYPDSAVVLSPQEKAAIPAAVASWVAEMDRRGVRLEGHVLRPINEAATIRIRRGELLVSDGPVTDEGLQISGFNILDCADRAEALEVAAKHPVAKFGILELRSFADS